MEKLVSLSRVTDIICTFDVGIEKDAFYEITREIELLPVQISNKGCCEEQEVIGTKYYELHKLLPLIEKDESLIDEYYDILKFFMTHYRNLPHKAGIEYEFKRYIDRNLHK